MPMDLTAAGPKQLAGAGGGTGPSDLFTQTIQDLLTEAALGTPGDIAWSGVGNSTIVAALKALVLGLAGTTTVLDGSGTITTGGAAQNLFGGSTPINGYMVQNLSGVNLYINDLGTATAGSGSILIPPNGSTWVTPGRYKPPGPVSIFGANTGQPFTARRW